jgi:hypothetical protein
MAVAREIAELVADYHRADDEHEQAAIVLLLAAALKERDGPGPRPPVIARISALLSSAGNRHGSDFREPAVASPQASEAASPGAGRHRDQDCASWRAPGPAGGQWRDGGRVRLQQATVSTGVVLVAPADRSLGAYGARA